MNRTKSQSATFSLPLRNIMKDNASSDPKPQGFDKKEEPDRSNFEVEENFRETEVTRENLESRKVEPYALDLDDTKEAPLVDRKQDEINRSNHELPLINNPTTSKTIDLDGELEEVKAQLEETTSNDTNKGLELHLKDTVSQVEKERPISPSEESLESADQTPALTISDESIKLYGLDQGSKIAMEGESGVQCTNGKDLNAYNTENELPLSGREVRLEEDDESNDGIGEGRGTSSASGRDTVLKVSPVDVSFLQNSLNSEENCESSGYTSDKEAEKSRSVSLKTDDDPAQIVGTIETAEIINLDEVGTRREMSETANVQDEFNEPIENDETHVANSFSNMQQEEPASSDIANVLGNLLQAFRSFASTPHRFVQLLYRLMRTRTLRLLQERMSRTSFAVLIHVVKFVKTTILVVRALYSLLRRRVAPQSATMLANGYHGFVAVVLFVIRKLQGQLEIGPLSITVTVNDESFLNPYLLHDFLGIPRSSFRRVDHTLGPSVSSLTDRDSSEN